MKILRTKLFKIIKKIPRLFRKPLGRLRAFKITNMRSLRGLYEQSDENLKIFKIILKETADKIKFYAH